MVTTKARGECIVLIFKLVNINYTGNMTDDVEVNSRNFSGVVVDFGKLLSDEKIVK